MQKEIASIQQKKSKRDYADQQQSLERRETELQQNWFNIATTTVIAYYNAAVESEFTCQWQEALDLYNEALYLSERSMRQQNSLTPKIIHAITKVSMKVRNQVQLPKLRPKKVLTRSTFRSPHDESNFTAKPSQQTTLVGQKSQNTKVSANQSSNLPGNINIINGLQMGSTDIPISVCKIQDPKVSSGEAIIAQIQDSLMSDGEHILEPYVEGTINTAKQTSVGDQINSETINIKQLSMFDSKKLNFVEDPSLLQGDLIKKRSYLKQKQSKQQGRKSPLSIRQIINRLEKQQNNQLSQENQLQFYRNNRTIQTVHIGQERSMLQNQAQKSYKNEWLAKLKTNQFVNFNTRRLSQQPRFGFDEADEQEEAGMLPQIGLPPNSAGHTDGFRLFSKNDDRIRTQVGTAGIGMVGQSYLSQRQTQTNYNKKRTKVPIRSGWMKDSFNKNNSNRRSEMPSKMTTSIETHPIKDGFDIRGQNFELTGAQELTSNRESEFSKAFTSTQGAYFRMDKRFLTPRSSNVRVSPVSLQLLLNKEQEQRQKYIELKSIEAQQRHNREVKYFANHLQKQTNMVQNRDLVSSDDEYKSNFRKEYEKITQKITSAVYLPEKLKKDIKRQHLKKQFQNAIKLRDELQEQEQAMQINQQMQEVFQKEMGKWKIEQEQIMNNKLKSFEQDRLQKETEQIEQLNAQYQIKEEQARQEIDRLKEYTMMVEAASQEAQRQLIAQQQEKATQDLRRAAAVDVSTSTLVKEIKSNATLTVQVDRMDQNTSIQSFREQKPLYFDMNTSVEGLASDKVDKQNSAMSLPYNEPVQRVDQITSTEGLEPAAIARRATQMSLISSVQSKQLNVTETTRQNGTNSNDFILVENSIIRLTSHASGDNQQVSEISIVEDQQEQKSNVKLSSQASGNNFPRSEISQIEGQQQQKSSVKLSSLASRDGNQPFNQISSNEDQHQKRSSVKPSSHASGDKYPQSEISTIKQQQCQTSSVRLSSHASQDNLPLSDIPYHEDQQQQQSSAIYSEQGQSIQEDVQVQSRVETVTSSRNQSVVAPIIDLTTNQIDLKNVSTSSPKHYIRYSQDHPEINQQSQNSHQNDQSYAVRTVVQSKQDRIMRSSQAISEMIAKVNPQMEESNYMDESDNYKQIPKVTHFVPRPIPKVAQSSEKRTITYSTLNQHSEQQYEINMFGEISIIGEEDIANWQIQANKFGAQGEINEIDVEESVAETDQQTDKVNKFNAFIGEGPIFIQRKTSYRIREDESKSSTKTLIKKGQTSTRIRLELEHENYSQRLHELATRPKIERNKTSTQVNQEIHKIKQISIKSGLSTIQHETTKRPLNQSIQRVQVKGMSVKNSNQIQTQLKDSSDSQTNGTEKVERGKHDAVLALIKDVDLRTDTSEITQKPKNARLISLYKQIEKSESSCYTNVAPILQSNITKPPPKIKSKFKKSIPNNEYCLNVAINQMPQPELIQEKRFARISDHIQKLNLQLEQFQVDLEQQMNDPLLKSSRRSDYVQAAQESLKDITPVAKRGIANTHTSELTVVPKSKDLLKMNEKQIKASQLTKSTLPKNIHQSQMEEQRELESEQTEGILVEEVLSAVNNHSQATQRTSLQRVPIARNQL